MSCCTLAPHGQPHAHVVLHPMASHRDTVVWCTVVWCTVVWCTGVKLNTLIHTAPQVCPHRTALPSAPTAQLSPLSPSTLS